MQAIIVFVNTIKEHSTDEKLENCIDNMNAHKNTDVTQVFANQLKFILIFLTCFRLSFYILSLKDEIRNQSYKAEGCIDYNCKAFPSGQTSVPFFNKIILIIVTRFNSSIKLLLLPMIKAIVHIYLFCKTPH